MFITILEVSKLVLHTGWMNALCTILEVSKLVLHTGEVLCSHMKNTQHHTGGKQASPPYWSGDHMSHDAVPQVPLRHCPKPGLGGWDKFVVWASGLIVAGYGSSLRSV